MIKPSTTSVSTNTVAPLSAPIELICRCDSMAALRAAVDHGADCVHLDYRHSSDNDMSDSHFKGSGIARAVRYAHDQQRRVLLAVTASMPAVSWLYLRNFIDQAAAAGVDAILLSDPALMLYSAAHHPGLRLHYVLPEGAANEKSLHFLHRQFGITRVVLPRVLSLPVLEGLAKEQKIELAVYGQGKFLMRADAANSNTPDFRYAPPPTATSAHLLCGSATAPTKVTVAPCADGEHAANDQCFAIGRPSDSNTLKLLPRLAALGIRAVWTETFEHAPIRLAQVTRVWREAIDNCLENLDRYAVNPSWMADLGKARRELPRR